MAKNEMVIEGILGARVEYIGPHGRIKFKLASGKIAELTVDILDVELDYELTDDEKQAVLDHNCLAIEDAAPGIYDFTHGDAAQKKFFEEKRAAEAEEAKRKAEAEAENPPETGESADQVYAGEDKPYAPKADPAYRPVPDHVPDGDTWPPKTET